ncbi:hypothetical protein [Actinotalea sp.]|uniref:hypothetical protein n=1 Tax=Actinotalea sp. TaxID=1872145 RepID=UPI0035632ED4
MTAPTQDTFDAVLGAIATDWRPSRVDSREAVRQAVMTAAREHHGQVTAATVRPHLPAWVNPASIGAAINAFRLGGYLIRTGWAPNGGPSRNGAKRSPVYRLTRVIPKETTP